MHHGAREHAVDTRLVVPPVETHVRDGAGTRTGDLGVEIGEAQAALLAAERALGIAHDGIDQDERHLDIRVERDELGALTVRRDVDNANRLGPAHLFGSESEPLLGVHRLEHRGRQISNRLRDSRNFDRLLPEHRIPKCRHRVFHCLPFRSLRLVWGDCRGFGGVLQEDCSSRSSSRRTAARSNSRASAAASISRWTSAMARATS